MTRIISGVAMALLAAGLILYATAQIFFVATIAVILWGLVEYFRMMRTGEIETLPLPGVALGAAVGAMVYVGESDALFEALVVTLLAVLILAALRSANPFESAVYTLFGVFYISLTLITLPLIRDGFEGGALLITLVVTNAFGDIFAYYTGRKFGKRKLAPAISPNKTVEGFMGGVVGALLAPVIIWYVIQPESALIDFVALGLIAGLLGPLGDLTESAIKRATGVKDSGSLIPGHGGILDRIDSLMFSAPGFYLYLILVV